MNENYDILHWGAQVTLKVIVVTLMRLADCEWKMLGVESKQHMAT